MAKIGRLPKAAPFPRIPGIEPPAVVELRSQIAALTELVTKHLNLVVAALVVAPLAMVPLVDRRSVGNAPAVAFLNVVRRQTPQQVMSDYRAGRRNF